MGVEELEEKQRARTRSEEEKKSIKRCVRERRKKAG